MSLLTLLLIALAVSADAFAVAVGKGLQMRRFDSRAALVLAATFGVFQAGMPLVGYLLGTGLENYITQVDHWIVFGLLTLVGAKMIREALRDDDGPDDAIQDGACLGGPVTTRTLDRELLVLGVATSLDALAVGIGFALLDVNVGLAVLLIGACTAVLSYIGVVLGQRAGARYRAPAEVTGGLVLVAIGLKVLLDHLHVL